MTTARLLVTVGETLCMRVDSNEKHGNYVVVVVVVVVVVAVST